MSRTLLLVFGALGATLILLLVNDQRGTTLGLANAQFAQIASLGVWGAVLAAGILRRGMRFQDAARQAAVWLVILMAMVAGYQYRFELQNIASRVSTGLVPSRPRTEFGVDGAAIVTIAKSNSGHFEVDGSVNGAAASFVVDTGATDIVLSFEDAAAAGFKQSELNYFVPVSTANGSAMAAQVRLDEISIGGIVRRNVKALVAEQGKLSQSLLGMGFLSSLSGYTVRQDQLLLQD